LTQPIVQGIVERGRFFHSVHGFEWYLSLERYLPLYPSNLRNHRTAKHTATCNQLLSVNQVEATLGDPPYTDSDRTTNTLYAVRINAVLASWRQESNKSLLLKMAICRQSIGYSPLAHQNKANRIAQGIPLVLPSKQKPHSLSVQLLINPDCFYVRVINQVNYKL
jgi:hypothetical protein